MGDVADHDLGESGAVPQLSLDAQGGDPNQMRNELIGFGLVVCASAGICAALNIQKYVHTSNIDPMTGEAKVNFVRLPLWWGGILLNTAAELVRVTRSAFVTGSPLPPPA
eukprot:2604751-Prymnesium_polylepis.1